MFIYLDHGRYELANSKVDHTQVHWGKCLFGLVCYVLGHINVESIAQLAISSSKIGGRRQKTILERKLARAPHNRNIEHVAIQKRM